MDWAEIRRLAIISMFSDDTLMEQLVLKGGNALNLVHGLGSRTSLDIDLSLDGDFADAADAEQRIFRALASRFAAAGYHVFDLRFLRKPAEAKDARFTVMSGYTVEFKLVENSRSELTREDVSKARREALVVGPEQQRVFRIEISKFEYCKGKVEVDLDAHTVYVYTPVMIAIEKLRALCQQMKEYTLRPYKTARARDFYDIHVILEAVRPNLGSADHLELARNIFVAKEVPAMLIAKLPDYREFHRQDWPAVQLTVAEELEDFDFYFEYVVRKTDLLKPLWDV